MPRRSSIVSDEEAARMAAAGEVPEKTAAVEYDISGQVVKDNRPATLAKTAPPGGSEDKGIKTAPTTINPRINAELLEEAANMILAQFQPQIREYAMEIADHILQIPRWHLVAGCVMNQYEQGTMVSPAIDLNWALPNRIDPAQVPLCEECQKEFRPKRMGQRYCSPECGVKANQRQIAAMKAERFKNAPRSMKQIEQEIEDAEVQGAETLS